MILAQMDHFEEAELRINSASVIFADINDSVRFLQAGLVHGNLFVRQKRYADAEHVFRDLLNVAVSSGDAETEARLHNNLGYCYVNLDDYKRANIHFSESIAKFTDLGFGGEIARTVRSAAVVLLNKGQFELGCDRLRQARTAFAKLQMPEEAGLCALRLIEALVERGQISEARKLSDAVIKEFTAAVVDARTVSRHSRSDQSLRGA